MVQLTGGDGSNVRFCDFGDLSCLNDSVISVKNEPLVRGQGKKPKLTRKKPLFFICIQHIIFRLMYFTLLPIFH